MEKRKSRKCSRSVMLNLFQHLVVTKGFTLLEVIVAIIIIGALLAFALPKYETALDKSRFSTLMPITKSIKDAEEIFYVASNQYTPDIQSLDVKTNPGETVQISVVDDDDYSYVQAIDPRIENIYKAYLRHSTNFPEERHCEALTESARAHKVCENLGGESIGENGSYTVYALDTNGGNGSFEKQCEGAAPETTQTCASGCGTLTRTVSCNTRTGEWEMGDFEGDCPVQGAVTQSCTSGVGTETRTFTCQGNTWVAGEWDTSSCTCDPEEKPAATQTCTSGIGTESRTVSCEGTSWSPSAWDTSACTCDPAAEPATTQDCTEGTGTETRTNTCSGTTWIEGTWDTSACVLPKKITSIQSCAKNTTYSDCKRAVYDDGTYTEYFTYSDHLLFYTYNAKGKQIAFAEDTGSYQTIGWTDDNGQQLSMHVPNSTTSDSSVSFISVNSVSETPTGYQVKDAGAGFAVSYNQVTGAITGYTANYYLVSGQTYAQERYLYTADGVFDRIYRSRTVAQAYERPSSLIGTTADLSLFPTYTVSEGKALYCTLAPADTERCS